MQQYAESGALSCKFRVNEFPRSASCILSPSLWGLPHKAQLPSLSAIMHVSSSGVKPMASQAKSVGYIRLDIEGIRHGSQSK